MRTNNQPKCFSCLKLFERFINDSKKGKRLQSNGKKVSIGTIIGYKAAFRLLKQFCIEKGFYLRIKLMNQLQGKEVFCEINYWKNFYKKFSDYLYNDCGYYDNYVGSTFKHLRTFFNYLNKDLALGAGDFYKSFYIFKEEIAIFPLMPEQLNFLIFNNEFEEKLSRRMKEVKDFFVFGCSVALRFSDLVALKASNIRIENGTYYLCVKSAKTGTESLVKLPPYAVAIVNRYKKLKKRLLPKFNLTNANIFIKPEKMFEELKEKKLEIGNFFS